MITLSDYNGREQSYVKHVFLENYLNRLASSYTHIVYVDGFAGPWQSASELFEDTSFGIALNALRRAKASWKKHGREVKMSAFLVERSAEAYERLAQIAPKYPDIAISTYSADFLTVIPEIIGLIPRDAFSFFLIDPKGWRIPLNSLSSMLARPKSEVIFNFMFDFINRAAGIDDPVVISGLNALIPYGNWRMKLKEAEQNQGKLSSSDRKSILVGAFTESLAVVGRYPFVAETTILRPIQDRALYCLCYATRSSHGVEVFRDCQVKALTEQARTRASAKLKRAAASTGRGELFESLYEMAPDELVSFVDSERSFARNTLIELIPALPDFIRYEKLWPQILLKHVIRLPDVNKLVATLRADGIVLVPDWENERRVPQQHYRIQRA
jgi:three-Cys-motif partner protein